MKAIEVHNLCKSYNDVQVLKEINLTVEKGEVFGLLGANGAGKSTVIECILGTKNFENGKISILGMNPKKERKQLFQNVGVQFQESNYQDKITVKELCETTEVVFLDELTTGLDVKSRRDVWKSLLKLKEQGFTIFLTSHFMDEVEVLCDRISILKNGMINFSGTIEEAVKMSPYEKFEDTYLWFLDEGEEKNESI